MVKTLDFSKAIVEYKQRFEAVKAPKTPDQWEEYNRLFPINEKISILEKTHDEIKETQELSQGNDPEMAKLAAEELPKLDTKLQETEAELKQLIYADQNRPDEADEGNAIIEIRAGAGGEEAAIFAGDLYRMYSLYAEKKGFKVEIYDRSVAEGGGIKEIIAKIEGKGVFGLFKNESGVHRVQRIPATESSGRIHTSTASVAVLPEAKSVDVNIKPEDIRIDVYRSSGAGGQHVNKTESAVRITHFPTGIVVACQDGRSQLQNRETAMNILRSRVYDRMRQEQQAEEDSLRRDQIGSAMRAEKIRTYNYPQSRITDHRLKKSWYNLSEIMNGDLDDIFKSFNEFQDA